VRSASEGGIEHMRCEPFPALTDMTDIAGRTLHFDFAGCWLGFLVNMVDTMHRTDDFPHALRKAENVLNEP